LGGGFFLAVVVLYMSYVHYYNSRVVVGDESKVADAEIEMQEKIY
jgi:hypothetical protein